jgi:hypothetical protein
MAPVHDHARRVGAWLRIGARLDRDNPRSAQELEASRDEPALAVPRYAARGVTGIMPPR